MRTPPKAKKCQDIIDKLANYLSYYINDAKVYQEIYNKDIKYLRDYINKISMEAKVQNIQLAAKIKKEMKENDAGINNDDNDIE